MARQRATSAPSRLSQPPSDQSTAEASAAPVNATTERDPLFPPFPPSNAQNILPPTNLFSKTNLIILVAVLCHALINYATSTSIFNSAVRDQIRRQWDSERSEHRAWEKVREAERMEGTERHCKKMTEEEDAERDQTRRQWDSERAQWDSERVLWESERTQWNTKRSQWNTELTQWESERTQWESERAQWDSERASLDSERKQWDIERALLDSERKQWDTERGQRDSERRAWEKAREKERKEDAERQRKKKAEEEEKRRAGIHWLGLERSPHCERYGARKYWAKLGPVPRGYDRLNACSTTEVEIHGRKVKPTDCEDKGTDRGVWGYWVVDFNEAGCRPSWEKFKDKGCTAPGSGLRRFDARLMNLDGADRWDSMCSSTPTDFKGLHFDGAMSCANKGMFGVYGSWNIGDKKCR